jgi:hypothetical protein
MSNLKRRLAALPYTVEGSAILLIIGGWFLVSVQLAHLIYGGITPASVAVSIFQVTSTLLMMAFVTVCVRAFLSFGTEERDKLFNKRVWFNTSLFFVIAAVQIPFFFLTVAFGLFKNFYPDAIVYAGSARGVSENDAGYFLINWVLMGTLPLVRSSLKLPEMELNRGTLLFFVYC